MSLVILNTDDYTMSEKEIRYIVEIMAHPKVLAKEPDYRNQQDVDHLFLEVFKSSRDPSRKGQHVNLMAKLDNVPVGFLGIHRQAPSRNHVGVVGIAVHPDHWRKGIGTKLLTTGVELATHIGMTQLEANILAYNVGMRKLAEKTGFKLIEIKKQTVNMFGTMENIAYYVKLL